jgi:plasmid stability protein
LNPAAGPITEFAFRQRSLQNAAMAAITIRDVPDETRDELASRAALSGRSLQEYLRLQLIEIARKPDPNALLSRIRARKQQVGSRLSVEAIVGHIEADRP